MSTNNQNFVNPEEQPAGVGPDNSGQPQGSPFPDQAPPNDGRLPGGGHYIHQDMYSQPPNVVNNGNMQGGRKKNPSCKWPVFFAVLLTASLTFLLTAGIGYVLFGKTILNRAASQGTADPGQIEGSAPSDNGSEPSGTIGVHSSKEGLSLTFPDQKGVREALEKFTSVYNILQENYYREYSDAEMIEKMTEGLTKQMGSQYTFYLTPEYHASVEESMKGEYVGIGAIVMRDQNAQYIVNDLIPGGPAEKNGLHVGDIITKVDDKDVSAFEDVGQLAAMVRGEAGTDVTIVVYRSSEAREMTFKLTRASITNVSVRSRMLDSKIGYVQVSEFSENTAKNFEQAVSALKEQGAESYIFDLRNNGGGYAHECIGMLDVLLPPMEVASLKGREAGKPYTETWKTSKPALVPEDTKFVVLLNENSASASELFTGVLHDLGRAVIVGQKSFGKGVGTITYQLEDKSAVQVTNFEYYLPKGECIEGKGLDPDYTAALSKEAAGKPISMLTIEEDTQLSKAIEILRSK